MSNLAASSATLWVSSSSTALGCCGTGGTGTAAAFALPWSDESNLSDSPDFFGTTAFGPVEAPALIDVVIFLGAGGDGVSELVEADIFTEAARIGFFGTAAVAGLSLVLSTVDGTTGVLRFGAPRAVRPPVLLATELTDAPEILRARCSTGEVVVERPPRTLTVDVVDVRRERAVVGVDRPPALAVRYEPVSVVVLIVLTREIGRASLSVPGERDVPLVLTCKRERGVAETALPRELGRGLAADDEAIDIRAGEYVDVVDLRTVDRDRRESAVLVVREREWMLALPDPVRVVDADSPLRVDVTLARDARVIKVFLILCVLATLALSSDGRSGVRPDDDLVVLRVTDALPFVGVCCVSSFSSSSPLTLGSGVPSYTAPSLSSSMSSSSSSAPAPAAASERSPSVVIPTLNFAVTSSSSPPSSAVSASTASLSRSTSDSVILCSSGSTMLGLSGVALRLRCASDGVSFESGRSFMSTALLLCLPARTSKARRLAGLMPPLSFAALPPPRTDGLPDPAGTVLPLAVERTEWVLRAAEPRSEIAGVRVGAFLSRTEPRMLSLRLTPSPRSRSLSRRLLAILALPPPTVRLSTLTRMLLMSLSASVLLV